MGLLNGLAQRKLNNIVELLESIDVKPGKLNHNYYCQHNACHYALKNKERSIIICFYKRRREDNWSLHFINTNGKSYTDNTLGNLAVFHAYKKVRVIDHMFFHVINDVFTNERKKFNNLLPWYVRLFSDGRH